jgi:hypothetical protein
MFKIALSAVVLAGTLMSISGNDVHAQGTTTCNDLYNALNNGQRDNVIKYIHEIYHDLDRGQIQRGCQPVFIGQTPSEKSNDGEITLIKRMCNNEFPTSLLYDIVYMSYNSFRMSMNSLDGNVPEHCR